MEHQAHRAFKNQLYEQFARVGKALANPHRLELIDLLAQRERTVEDLAQETNMSIASTSQHLQAMRDARLVEVRRDGLYAYYRLADERVYNAWRALRELGEARLTEIEHVVKTFLEERETMQSVSAAELLAILRDKTVVVLDVRPESEYRSGHIRGARSIPISELESRLKELPKRADVVAYCRGPYCVFADEAVALLRKRGYRVRRLAAGFPEWQADGLPVDLELAPRDR
jgi:rhodanese-related sulfurtransferase/DNA-binding transcriptional ArsR family regulator